MSEQQPEIASKKLEIDIDDIVNIFQLSAPDRYVTASTTEELRLHRSNTLFLLEQMGSKVADILDDEKNVTDIEVSYSANTSGEVIYIATYDFKTPSGDIKPYITIAMAKAENIGSEADVITHIEPFMVCSGIVDNNGKISLEDIIARLPDDEHGRQMAQAETVEDSYAMMLYADAFFTSMLRGVPVTLEDLKSHFDTDAVATSEQEYQKIKKRTRYDANAIMQGDAPNDKSFRLYYEDIKKAFQLDNEEYYNMACEDDYDAICANVKDMLKLMGSSYAAHFEQGVTFEEIPPTFIENSHGDSMWCLGYSHTDLCGVERNYEMVILAAGLPTQPGKANDLPQALPLAVIVAEVDYTDDLYVPLEAICKIDKDISKNPYLRLNTSEGFVSAVCYTEIAMEHILIDDGPIRKLNLSQWLLIGNFKEMMDRYRYICGREEYGFKRGLEDLKKSGDPQLENFSVRDTSGTGYFMSAAPAPEGYKLN